jgi:hypothetical protein
MSISPSGSRIPNPCRNTGATASPTSIHLRITECALPGNVLRVLQSDASQRFAQRPALPESNEPIGNFCNASYEADMATNDSDVDTLLETDRFVRLMAAAPGTGEIVAVVRDSLASWSGDRIVRLQAAHAGWAPFDDHQQPYPIVSVRDVRQIRNSARIRCRELEASGRKIEPELLELDLFLFFANESLDAHEPRRRQGTSVRRMHELWRSGIAAGRGDRNAAEPGSVAWQ